MKEPSHGLTLDHWQQLRELTDARIALGRAGASLPTRAHLDFQLAHAQARDAVHWPFEPERLTKELSQHQIDSLVVSSRAADRQQYLQRPDLGRHLNAKDQEKLGPAPCDICLVIGDGLSALAAHQHAGQMAIRLHKAFFKRQLSVAPIVIARSARVALADEIGERVQARLTIILLGERPGLSSPDSLGAYLTWAPASGRHDAHRNCVSNIRPNGGLDYGQATHRLIYLTLESFKRKLSGIDLKDQSDSIALLD